MVVDLPLPLLLLETQCRQLFLKCLRSWPWGQWSLSAIAVLIIGVARGPETRSWIQCMLCPISWWILWIAHIIDHHVAIGLKVNYLSILICRHSCWGGVFVFFVICDERASESIGAFTHLSSDIILHHRFSCILAVNLARLVDDICGKQVMFKYIVRWISHINIVSLIWAEIRDYIVHSFSIAQQVTGLVIFTLCVWKRNTGFSLAEPGVAPWIFLRHEFHSWTGPWFDFNRFNALAIHYLYGQIRNQNSL